MVVSMEEGGNTVKSPKVYRLEVWNPGLRYEHGQLVDGARRFFREYTSERSARRAAFQVRRRFPGTIGELIPFEVLSWCKAQCGEKVTLWKD